jgi:hypothetical protein
MVFISTDAATSFLPLPSPTTGGRVWVVLLHHYIHAYKIICFFSTWNNKNTHLIILNIKMCIHVLLIYIQSECLTLYIINNNYQWILTLELLKYMLSSKLWGLFSYSCMLQNFCFNLYFIYLYLCFSYIYVSLFWWFFCGSRNIKNGACI